MKRVLFFLTALMLLSCTDPKQIVNTEFEPVLDINSVSDTYIDLGKTIDMVIKLNNKGGSPDLPLEYTLTSIMTSGSGELFIDGKKLADKEVYPFATKTANENIKLSFKPTAIGKVKIEIHLSNVESKKSVEFIREVRPALNFEITPKDAGTVRIDSVNSFAYLSPNKGYQYEGVYFNKSLFSKKNPITFTWNENKEYEVKFTYNKYAVNISSDPIAIKSVTGKGNYIITDKLICLATLNAGYKVKEWRFGKRVLSVANPLNITMNDLLPEELEIPDIMIECFAVQNSYTVSADFVAEQIAIKGLGSYEYLDTARVSAQEKKGFKFIAWNEGSEFLTKERNFEVIINKDHHYRAITEKIIYQITSTVIGLGTTIGTGSYSYLDKVSLEAKPKVGNKFIGWYEKDTLYSDAIKIDFIVEQDRHFTARFEEMIFSVTLAKSNYGGEVSPLSKSDFRFGEGVSLTATPIKYYIFDHWLINEIRHSEYPILHYTVEQNAVIQAIFKKASCNITISYDFDVEIRSSGDPLEESVLYVMPDTEQITVTSSLDLDEDLSVQVTFSNGKTKILSLSKMQGGKQYSSREIISGAVRSVKAANIVNVSVGGVLYNYVPLF